MVLQVVAENVERARSETMTGFLKHGHKNWHSLELAAIQDRDLLSGSRVDEPRLNHINLYARQTQGQKACLVLLQILAIYPCRQRPVSQKKAEENPHI